MECISTVSDVDWFYLLRAAQQNPQFLRSWRRKTHPIMPGAILWYMVREDVWACKALTLTNGIGTWSIVAVVVLGRNAKIGTCFSIIARARLIAIWMCPCSAFSSITWASTPGTPMIPWTFNCNSKNYFYWKSEKFSLIRTYWGSFFYWFEILNKA